jgi:hypothetical protein
LEFKHPGAISLLFKVEIKIVAMLEKREMVIIVLANDNHFYFKRFQIDVKET